jgi:hypothetical protein
MPKDILMKCATPIQLNQSSSARKQKEIYFSLDLNNAGTTFSYHF